MRLSSAGRRAVSVVLTVLSLFAASLLTATPATAVNRATPGNFTGYGFDQCEAPSQTAMDAWLRNSPYWAVGIYIAGGNRACKEQRNLTPAWVDTQLRSGWRLLPINVGPQASCYENPHKKLRIKADPTADYAAARRQAQTAALATVAAASELGIASGSTLWYDLEHTTGLVTKERCRESALRFLDTWTETLHREGYRSGVYAHLHSGAYVLDQADAQRPGLVTMPDQLWFARWNETPMDDEGYLRPTSWMPHARVHQYRGDHIERHGGVAINIDSNYLDVGRGSVAPRAGRSCGVQIDFDRYPSLRMGDTGAEVSAAQCLLRKRGSYSGELSGTYDQAMSQAVAAFQQELSLPTRGVLNRRTWVALLVEGPAPIVKYGSAKHAVRRLQRGLNAATGAGLDVTGVFEGDTTRAVQAYQASVDLPRTGVVAENTWAALQTGRR